MQCLRFKWPNTSTLFLAQSRSIKSQAIRRPPLAFAFDIDGVLLRGETPIPAAKRAFDILEGNNLFGRKIPFILLTNGGGVGEEQRCHKLTEQLGFPIQPSQYIQAHTVLKQFAPTYADAAVLVLGGERDIVRKIAQSYGFKDVYTPLDVHAWNPSIWPFHKLTHEERTSTVSADFSKIPISAMFVFHDPRNWALDVQILCDVIQSGGTIGSPYISPQDQLKKNLDLVFCNPDLIWRADFDLPRIGQGAFREAFQAVYKSLTGNYYPHIQYGKPTTPTYQFAEKTLKNRIQELYGCDIGSLPNVYMIGDNPESDIAGANSAGWSSVLVDTGVYDPCQGAPPHKPTHHSKDVAEAVEWAIHHEYNRAKE